MDNLEIYNNFRDVPPEAKKPISAGRMKGKTDINPMWRIKALTQQFGPCGIGWYYKTTNKWVETFELQVAAFVDIELYIKVNNEWSMPINGTGGSMFVSKENSGPYVSDECYKMATTDAISVACKQLGIGANVYWDSDKSKYTNNSDKTEPENSIHEIYKCENCGAEFKGFVWKEKQYSAKDNYEISKKKCSGKALCNKCKKEAGL